MKKHCFFAIAMAAVLTLGLTSCKDDDETYDGLTMTADTEYEIETLEHDPTAAYPVHFKIGMRNDSIVITNMTSKPALVELPNTMDLSTAATIADCGRTGKLDKIAPTVSDIPEAADFGNGQPIEEKHGYVIEAHGSANLNSYQNDLIHDPTSLYVRFWVEEVLEDGSLHVRYETYVPTTE